MHENVSPAPHTHSHTQNISAKFDISWIRIAQIYISNAGESRRSEYHLLSEKGHCFGKEKGYFICMS